MTDTNTDTTAVSGREILGVYSHSTRYQYKVGERGSRYRNGTYWFVCKVHDDAYEVQPLNANNLPSGVRRVIDRDEFIKYYTPELEYYQQNTIPCMETLARKVKLGRRYFNLGRLTDAEKEFCDVILMQEECVDANVGLSDVYSEQREFSKLREVLDRLLNSDDLFREEQRHKFNEFGINLRKREFYDDAIRFYMKAMEINGQDDHLHFNVARVLYEKGKLSDCREHLKQALKLNPRFPEAEAFLVLVTKQLGK